MGESAAAAHSHASQLSGKAVSEEDAASWANTLAGAENWLLVAAMREEADVTGEGAEAAFRAWEDGVLQTKEGEQRAFGLPLGTRASPKIAAKTAS